MSLRSWRCLFWPSEKILESHVEQSQPEVSLQIIPYGQINYININLENQL